MELSNSLPTGRKAAHSVTAQLHLAIDGETMSLSLQADKAENHEAAFTFQSPVANSDAGETRWLLEDHPRLQGRSADPIAARIEKRLHALAAELRRAVFESAKEAQPIRDTLANPELLAQLHVSIHEPQSAPWIPWELMLAPESTEPLSVVAASFTRVSHSAPAIKFPHKSDKLHVLLVTSRPSGKDDVPFRSVASRIVQAVAASAETAIVVDLLRPPTYQALVDTLAAASETDAPYNMVHFDGHGSYETDVFDESNKRGYLHFEGPDGSIEAVSGAVLGADLVQHNVSYLLLNACRSAYVESSSAPADAIAETTERAFGTLAAEVRAEGVAGVLGMGFNLYVVTAARLVANTYAALASGYNLSEAVGHARRDLYRANDSEVAGAFDWLVPIAFSGEVIAERERPDAISNLTVQASTTTPTSAAVIDPGANHGPRSDERPFFGYDDVLLRLDRACGASRAVEIVGIAGSGKSAVAGEFARWWAATTPDAAIVLDVDSFGTFNEFNEQFKTHSAEARDQTTEGGCLIVLEGANKILDGESEIWNANDRAALQQWIEQQMDSDVSLLMTGRAPGGLADETIVLEGLDQESRAELARHAGFDAERAHSLPGMLPWTQGIPAVVLQIPSIIETLPSIDAVTVRNVLSDLRSGKTLFSGPQLGMSLIQRAGLEFFNVSRLRRAALPFVLHLFQFYLADVQWKFFCELTVLNGLNLAGNGDTRAILEEELRPAVRAGLVSRMSHGYLLHPFAPIAIEPGLAATVQALTDGSPDLMRQVMGIAWVSYIQSVSATITMAGKLPNTGDFGPFRLQRENLTNAFEISVLGAWWGLALPLVHKLRDVLLAEARNEEWREILNEILVGLQKFPPEEKDMGPENATLHILRLLAEEAEREGNEEQAQALRDLQLQVAYSEDTTIQALDPGKEKDVDISRIRRISSLLKRGDVAARENSPESLVFYNEALRLAEEANDPERMGEVHLAIARTHLKVRALRDPMKYEFHARKAIKIARDLGALGLNLYVRASVSLGNAIVEGQHQLEQPDPKRLNEAREALRLGVTAENVEEITRGTAHNGLGNVYRIENDFEAAAAEYLAACKAFEAAGDTRSLRVAQRNAASALATLGKKEDALKLAQEADLTDGS